VLGPEKLPRVVSEIGRWVGRARAMARQFREQLEEEVQLEQARKAQAPTIPAPPPQAPPSPLPPLSAAATQAPVAPPDTFSHAHATDASGADPEAVRTGPTPSADERGT
jgi:sec-independent protein translocase protein TatB